MRSKEPDPALSQLQRLKLKIDPQASVTEQVHEALRGAIIDLRLVPGTPISENSICKQFSVSRTPVRAAIQRLSEEGLVEVSPQRGSYVAPLQLSRLHDSHFVRRALELALLHETASSWTEEKSRVMRAVIEDQRLVAATGDSDAFFREDERFHRTLAYLAGRAGVWTAIQAAKVTLTRFYRYWALEDRKAGIISEHIAVIDALDQGDATKAAEALGSHLDVVFVVYARKLEEAEQKSQIGSKL